MTAELLHWAALGCLLLPCAAVAVLGAVALFSVRPSEALVVRVFAPAHLGSWLASLCVLFAAVRRGPAVLHLADWYHIGPAPFGLYLLTDRLSAIMLALTTALCGLVGRFSYRYLHREPGFLRFFLLLGTFQAGMTLVVLADSLDLMFAGWEVVGVTSALLIGFFQERGEPARNGLLAFSIYRVCDVGLLLAAVLVHHYAHSARLDQVLGPGPWPAGGQALPAGQATLLCLLLLLAAMGKSAQFPLGSWLPRAMEGPTPSSAVFYGALSIHAGAYLLLRAAPLLSAAPGAAAAVVAVGLATAAHGTLSARVQSDIKGALAYASMTQVGLVFVEIGLGFPRLALWHLGGHAILRAWQLLRAPSALHEAHVLRGAGAQTHHGADLAARLPQRLQLHLFRAALERGFLEHVLQRAVVAPVWRLALGLDRLERRWTALLAGRAAGEERP